MKIELFEKSGIGWAETPILIVVKNNGEVGVINPDFSSSTPQKMECVSWEEYQSFQEVDVFLADVDKILEVTLRSEPPRKFISGVNIIYSRDKVNFREEYTILPKNYDPERGCGLKTVKVYDLNGNLIDEWVEEYY